MSFLSVILAATLFAVSCKSSDEAPPPPASGSLVEGFGTSGTATSNPTPLASKVSRSLIVGSALFIAGTDSLGPSDAQWRVEKRGLADGSLDPLFGVGGVVTSNPSVGEDSLKAIACDGTALYLVGYDEVGGDARWRIEKRSAADGSLVAAFGSGGFVASDPSANFDTATCVALDSSYLYAAGLDESLGASDAQWRVEKRSLADGALLPAFGGAGYVVSNLGAGLELATSIGLDMTCVYVGGWDQGGSGGRGRIEKRNLLTGALKSDFGSAGVASFDRTAGSDSVYWLSISAGSVFAVGYDDPLDSEWRIERLSAGDGSTIWSRTSNPSASDDYAQDAVLAGGFLYTAGYSYAAPPDGIWLVEKRGIENGALVASFGEGGAVKSNPSGLFDGAYAISADADSIYVSGTDASNGGADSQWRIEKRYK